MSDNFWRIHKGLNFTPQTTTPSNPFNGDTYYDSILNKLRCYQNGAWVNLSDTDGTVLLSNGSAASPSLSFASVGNDNTGIFLKALDSVGFSANGTEIGSFSSAGAWIFGAVGGTETHIGNGNIFELQSPSGTNAVLSVNALGGNDTLYRFLNTGITKWQLRNFASSSDEFRLVGASVTPLIITQTGICTFGAVGSSAAHQIKGNSVTITGQASTGFNIVPATGTSSFIYFGNSNQDWSIGSLGGSGTYTISTGNILGSNQKLQISSAGAITLGAASGTEAHQVNGSLLITRQLSTQLGADNSSTGTLNDVSSANTSFFRFTNNTGPTITGLANGSNGKRLSIIYTGSGTMQINNNDSGSLAANRIITGTNNNLFIHSGASVELIYDSTDSFWHLISGSSLATNAVGDWQSYTPTIGGAGTVSNNTAYWRQVGDTIEVWGRFTVGTPSASALKISLPSGYSLDTTKLPSAQTATLGSFTRATGSVTTFPVDTRGPWAIMNSTSTSITDVYVSGSVQNTSPVFIEQGGTSLVAVGDNVSYEFKAPIAGLSSNINVQNANEEFAYNTDTSDASDTTSFASGAEGVNFGSFSLQRSKRIQFLSTVQDTDIIKIEIFDGNNWVPLESSPVGASSVFITEPYHLQNTTDYGVGFRYVSGNPQAIDVTFGQYRVASGATYGAAGGAWSSVTGNKWRVRKTSAPGIVGFQPLSSDVKGIVDASEASTGYIGEAQRSYQGVVNISSSNIWQNWTTLSLTAGDWDITAVASYAQNGATVTAVGLAISAYSGNITTDHVTGDNVLTFLPPISTSQTGGCISNFRVNITSTTLYYVKIIGTFSAGNPQAAARISARRVR